MSGHSLRLLLLSLTTALAACGGDGPAGLDKDGNNISTAGLTEQRRAIQAAVDLPLLRSLFGDMGADGGLERFSAPRTAGPLLATAPSGAGLAAAVRAIRSELPIAAAPTSAPRMTMAALTEDKSGYYVAFAAWGRTYVKQNGAYVWDRTRSDAPSRGVRIVLYERTGYRRYSTTPVGYVDLIDNSASATNVVEGRIRLTTQSGTVIGDVTERITPTGSGNTTGRLVTATGTLGRAPQLFVIADTSHTRTTITGSGAGVTEDVSMDIKVRTSAPFANAEMVRELLGYSPYHVSSDKDAFEFRSAGRTLRIEAGVAGGGVAPLTFYLNGSLLGTVQYDEVLHEEVYHDPSGKKLGDDVISFVASFARAFDWMPTAMDLQFALGSVVPEEVGW